MAYIQLMACKNILFRCIVTAVLSQCDKLRQATKVISQRLASFLMFCPVEPISDHRSVDIVQAKILASEMSRKDLNRFNVLAERGQLASIIVLNDKFIT